MTLRITLLACTIPLIAACGTSTSTGSAPVLTDPMQSISLGRGFTARANATILPGINENVVRLQVIVTNMTAARSTLQIHGGCPVLMRAYRDNQQTAAFDDSDALCTLQLGLVTLEPWQEDTLTHEVTVPRIAPRGTPKGPYRIEALLAANTQDHPGRFALDAGYVTIP